MARFKIKELAQQRGLTQEELAFKSGVKMRTVQRLWQNRVGDSGYGTLSALARALNVRIEDLVEENHQDTQSPSHAAALQLA